jgi:hypothetical protein
MTLEQIDAGLTTLGIAHSVLPSGTDGAVLLLPEYGRVLGVWPHWRAVNALWVNPVFLDFLRVGVKDDRWVDPGGDRIWLGPAAEFVPDRDAVSASLDPGQYAGSATRAGFVMENRGETRAWRTGMRVRFRLTRTVRVLDETALAARWGKTWLRRAGYEEETALELDGDRPQDVRLLSLVDVPLDAEGHAPAGGDGRLGMGGALDGAHPAPARSPVLALQRGEQGRDLLVARGFDDGAAPGEASVTIARRHGAEVREIACTSGPAPGGRHKLLWRTRLCAFSGRAEEVQAVATGLSS